MLRMLLNTEFINEGERAVMLGRTDRGRRLELAHASEIIRDRFGCGGTESARLLIETAHGARMDLEALAQRLLEPDTRQAALAAVGVVLRDRRDGIG